MKRDGLRYTSKLSLVGNIRGGCPSNSGVPIIGRRLETAAGTYMSDDSSIRSVLESLTREELIERILSDQDTPEPCPGCFSPFPWVDAMLTSTTFSMAIVDAQFRFTTVNPAFCAFTGYARDELEGQHISFTFLRSDIPSVGRLMGEIGQTGDGDGQCFQRRYRHKTGQVRWGSVSLNTYHDPVSGERNYLALVQDITQQKQAEQALSSSEERLRLITDTAPSLIAYLTPDLRYEFVNRSYVIRYDLPPHHIVGKRLRDLISPDRFEKAREQFEIVLAGEAVEFETIIPLRGVPTHVRVNYLPDFDERNVLRGFVSIIEDIERFKIIEQELRETQESLESRVETRTTALIRSNHQLRKEISDRRKAEHALVKQATQLRQAQLLAKMGFWRLDLKTSQLTVSPEMALILEVPHEELSQIQYADFVERFIYPEDAGNFEKLMGTLPDRGWQYETEYRLVSGSGKVKWIAEIGEAIRGPDGRDHEEIGMMQDITERKNAEAQLTQALKMEAVGQLTGGIAHDFNNLLAVIMGSAELLSPEHDAALVEEIIQAARRGAELTGRLVAFSRSQSLVPKVVCVPDMVARLLDMLARTLGEAITIKENTAGGTWRIFVDEGQLENALLNLSLNARDAMPTGGVLEIAADNVRIDHPVQEPSITLEPGEYVRVSVKDTGTGVDSSLIDRVFEPFFTTKDIGQGSGLGLSMVYGFAKQSGGGVTIQSEADSGTCVSLYLPRTQAELAASVADDTHLPPGHGQVVVLVEDDPGVRALTQKSLSSLGYAVHVAADAHSGLSLVRKLAGVDLLLTDVILPGGMSGPDLAQAARSENPGLRVLFMSGYAPNEMIANANLREGEALLKKPFKLGELAQSLNERLTAPA